MVALFWCGLLLLLRRIFRTCQAHYGGQQTIKGEVTNAVRNKKQISYLLDFNA